MLRLRCLAENARQSRDKVCPKGFFDTMMTLNEIREAKINPLVAREAYEHASQRLSDTLETKKSFEQKAFTLFSGYITASTALFGIGGVLLKDPATRHYVLPFISAGFVLVLGAMFFVWALRDRHYGALASDPDMWLNRGTIDGDDSVVPLMLAYITFYHKERISTSTVENDGKAKKIRIGIYLGLTAPFVLFGMFVVQRCLQSLFH